MRSLRTQCCTASSNQPTNRLARTCLRSLLGATLLASVISNGLSEAVSAEPESELLCTITMADGTEIRRVDSAPVWLPPALASDPRFGSVPQNVSWEGFLESESEGTYEFFVYLSGEATITLSGRQLLHGSSSTPTWLKGTSVELEFGEHDLTIDYRPENSKSQFAFFWRGPGFPLERVPSTALGHREADAESSTWRNEQEFRRGRELARAYRCDACHLLEARREPLAAPPLRIHGTPVLRSWFVQHLSDTASGSDQQSPPTRRMPSFKLSQAEIATLTDFLLETGEETLTSPSLIPTDADEKIDVLKSGQQLFFSRGCVACHQYQTIGQAQPLDGGNLSHVSQKRTARFLRQWLADPAALHPDHRMPQFALTDEELTALTAFLSQPADVDRIDNTALDATSKVAGDSSSARRLIERHQCTACHTLTDRDGQVHRTDQRHAQMPLNNETNWDKACSSPHTLDDRPNYDLPPEDQRALRAYASALPTMMRHPASSHADTALRLAELNCFGCHERHDAAGLRPLVPRIVELTPSLADQPDLLTPPSLNGVGDKLTQEAFDLALSDEASRLRPWLRVQMPHFHLSQEERQRLASYFQATDEVPSTLQDLPSDMTTAERLAGTRLVTSEGFGCLSCHSIGRVAPERTAPGTRGPDLQQLSRRVREDWFYRFVQAPTRQIRHLEMPSITAAVPQTLEGNLEAQLAAVWQVLNTPDFEPPLPNPIRVVRQSGKLQSNAKASVLTDVLKTRDGTTFVKPLLIGFQNRHNVLYDLNAARLSMWSLGDVARQRTAGKSWYWEMAGEAILQSSSSSPELRLWNGQEEVPSVKAGQFASEFESVVHLPRGLRVENQLHFQHPDGTRQSLHLTQTLTPFVTDERSGWRRELVVSGFDPHQQVTLEIEVPTVEAAGAVVSIRTSAGDTRTVTGVESHRLDVDPLDAPRSGRLTVEYTIAGRPDIVETRLPPDAPTTPKPLHAVPGYSATQLPLPNHVMPISLAWSPSGTLYFGSLKGRVWQAMDSDGDGWQDQLVEFSDELASPYGIYASRDHVDVLTKFALLRLVDDDADGRADQMTTIASGWGHTEDYHDWAVGLPRDQHGCYYIALPCQQDERSAPAARWRGHTLRLVPTTSNDPHGRPYRVETLTRGHRFPMGLAINRHQELVVTDNQGNYNPFNELNHLAPGRHFGFINRLEKDGTLPLPATPLTPPAVKIPHPWTRSVNGICFLESSRDEADSPRFGPFEGHLIGCEYDTRRLIRMSLQSVNGTLQGAAYPFSLDDLPADQTFMGPICCAVSSDGDLYVGSIRDSGWGGANNLGEIVRLEPRLDELPCGIAEVQATSYGFRLRFTRPVDTKAASQTDTYDIVSYYRVSTPAYGGDDQDRRKEPIDAITVHPNGMEVDLHLQNLTAGRVYEFRLHSISPDGSTFFPAEAFYTLNERVPSPD